MATSLKNWFTKQGIAELWNSNMGETEEVLIMLASEKLWDDINEICENDIKLPKRKIPYLKAYLIERTRNKIDGNQNNDIDDVIVENTTKPCNDNDDNKQREEENITKQIIIEEENKKSDNNKPKNNKIKNNVNNKKGKGKVNRNGNKNGNKNENKNENKNINKNRNIGEDKNKHKEKKNKRENNKNNRNNNNKNNKKRNNKTKKDNKRNEKKKYDDNKSKNNNNNNDNKLNEETSTNKQEIDNKENINIIIDDDNDDNIKRNNIKDIENELSKMEIIDIKEAEYITNYISNGFKYKDIPIIDMSKVENEEEYLKYFDTKQCCILRQSNLLGDIPTKWSPQYLAKKVPNTKFDVKVSCSRDFRYCFFLFCSYFLNTTNVYFLFRRYNMNRNIGGHKIKEPNSKIEMTMIEFMKNVIESRQKMDKEKKKQNNNNYYYLQTSLGSIKELAMDIDEGIDKQHWNECLEIVKKCKWGSLMANDLLIGMKGSMIPLGYQENENIFISLNGYTEIILFSPICTPYLYPFPYGHPCYQQSMVNLEFINKDDNNKQFKNFNIKNEILNDNIYRCILSKGDVLYIPGGWWSEITNLNDFSINISFCNKIKNIKNIINNKIDINQLFSNKTIKQRIAIGRNLERIILQRYGANDNITTNIFKSFLTNDKNYTKYRNDIKRLLKNVFNEQEIEPFVIELVDGRYNIDFNSFIKI